MAELADAYGSGPYGATRGGSSPLVSTADPWALFVYGMIEHFRNRTPLRTWINNVVGNVEWEIKAVRADSLPAAATTGVAGPDELFPSFRVSAGGGDFRAARKTTRARVGAGLSPRGNRDRVIRIATGWRRERRCDGTSRSLVSS